MTAGDGRAGMAENLTFMYLLVLFLVEDSDL